MRNKIFLLGLLILFILSYLVFAGTPHTVWGNVNNAGDGTLADGSTVTVYIEGRSEEILTDIVGVTGSSGTSNAWSIDAGNFPSAWSVGETLIISVDNGNDYTSNTNLILNGAGSQQSITMTLSKSLELIKPAGKTGVNAISLLWDSQLSTAEDICNDIEYADTVTKWDADTQLYSGHPCGTPVNDFNLENGLGYFVSVTQNSIWVMK
jgi:hypothetical protein